MPQSSHLPLGLTQPRSGSSSRIILPSVPGQDSPFPFPLSPLICHPVFPSVCPSVCFLVRPSPTCRFTPLPAGFPFGFPLLPVPSGFASSKRASFHRTRLSLRFQPPVFRFRRSFNLTGSASLWRSFRLCYLDPFWDRLLDFPLRAPLPNWTRSNFSAFSSMLRLFARSLRTFTPFGLIP